MERRKRIAMANVAGSILGIMVPLAMAPYILLATGGALVALVLVWITSRYEL